MSPQALLLDPAFARLKDHVIRATGLAYYADKDRDLADRLARRLAQRRLTSGAAYLALLEDAAQGEAELDALIEDLTIGETFFFRHKELFDALRDVVLPEAIARNRQGRRLRIWSAGCATGAEPYSVSMLLRRELADKTAGWDIRIVGTDINRAFLAQAREGRFDEWALRATPDGLRQACFVPAGRSWLLAPEYRKDVSFQYHNLVMHPYPSLLNNLLAFDVILCRNVAIYFSLDIVRRIIGHFHECLVEGGWLLVGHAEPNLELFHAFRTVNVPGAVLYQKKPEHADPVAPARAMPLPFAAAPWTPAVWPQGSAAAPSLPEAARPVLAPGGSELDAVRALADRGEWPEAERRCRQILEQDRLNPAPHLCLALVLEQTGRHDEAEQTLRRVLYLDRRAALAHYYLGLLLQKKGQSDQAGRSFRNVLDLLADMEGATTFAAGDGITAAELTKLTEMSLQVLEET